MNINKKLVLKSRNKVIITSIILLVYILGGSLLDSYGYLSLNKSATIGAIVLVLHSFFCGRLYKVITDDFISAIVIGVLIIALTFCYFGIGTFFITVYLLLKARSTLKETA